MAKVMFEGYKFEIARTIFVAQLAEIAKLLGQSSELICLTSDVGKR